MTQEQRNKKAEQLRLAAQIVETGCGWEVKHPANTIWCSGNELLKATYSEPDSAVSSGYEIRIKEPVIPVPEGWRELRDPEPRVPLEPCDVPPGSVIDLKHGDEGWNAILCVDDKGITVLDENNRPQDYTFEELVGGHFESRIKRPTDTEWQPCSKPAP